MYLRCTEQVNAGYIVHFLVMYLRCTGSVHHPLPPVSYSLDTRPGTITQVETRAFATSFLGTGNYPTFRRVSSEIVTLWLFVY